MLKLGVNPTNFHQLTFEITNIHKYSHTNTTVSLQAMWMRRRGERQTNQSYTNQKIIERTTEKHGKGSNPEERNSPLTKARKAQRKV